MGKFPAEPVYLGDRETKHDRIGEAIRVGETIQIGETRRDGPNRRSGSDAATEEDNLSDMELMESFQRRPDAAAAPADLPELQTLSRPLAKLLTSPCFKADNQRA